MPCPRRPLPAFLAIAMDPIRPDPTLSVKIRALSPKGDRLLDRSVNRSVDKASSSAYLPACLPPRPPACLPAPGVPILNCNSELPIIPMGKRSQALSKAGAGAGAETSSTFLLLIALPPPPPPPPPPHYPPPPGFRAPTPPPPTTFYIRTLRRGAPHPINAEGGERGERPSWAGAAAAADGDDEAQQSSQPPCIPCLSYFKFAVLVIPPRRSACLASLSHIQW